MFRTLSLRPRWVRCAVTAFVVLAIGAVVSTLAMAQQAPQNLDQVQTFYQNASTTWRNNLLPIAQRTFMLLAALEFAVSGIVWAIKRESLDDLAAKFLLKFTLMSFMLMLITDFNKWLPAIFNGFVSAGQTAVGQQLASPSSLVSYGAATAWNIVHLMAASKSPLSFFNPLTFVLTSMYLGAAILMLLAFMVIAGSLIAVMIETYIVIFGGGVLFLAFAASRWTAAYAEHLIAHTFYLGVRAFFLYLFVAVGVSVIQEFQTEIMQSASWLALSAQQQFSMIMEMVTLADSFALMTLVLPQRVAWMLMGKTSLGLAQVYQRLA